MRDVCRYHSGIDKKTILRAVNSVTPKSKTIREFGLVFVSPRKMTELNLKYRRRNRATNVLSFTAGPSKELGVGDVAVCPKVVSAEAKKYGFTQKNWMTRLVVHAILHLAGYDHQILKDRTAMERLEKIILGKLGIICYGSRTHHHRFGLGFPQNQGGHAFNRTR